MQKTIFITGASSGLGKAAAKLFQSNGWNVLATMRKPEDETELNQLANVRVLKLDTTDQGQIIEVVQQVTSSHTVDVLLNNAGYGLVGPLEALSNEQIDRQVATNLLGTIKICKEFIPYFRQKRNGVIINITSMFGLVGYPTCSVYAATKFAIDGFSESLAYELGQFGVHVKIIAPGGIQTDFAGRSLDVGLHPAYEKLAKKVGEGYSEQRISQFSTAEQIAAVIYNAATDNTNKLRYIAGTDAIKLYNERIQSDPETQYQHILSDFI